MRKSVGIVIVAGLICVAIIGAVAGLARTGIQAQRPPAGSVACKDDVSRRVADEGRSVVPDIYPAMERRLRLNGFIASNRWLFDADHDGRLTFEEYLNSEWAGYLIQLPGGVCQVTKRDFLIRFLGDPQDPESYWKLPYQEQIVTGLYNEIDRTGKGYITREDIRSRARGSFSHSLHYAKHRGAYLTHDDI